MVQPPTPEGFAGGLANPAGRRGMFGRNRPMISIDPNTISQIGRVKDAVRGLTEQTRKLAEQAERYATAMGHATGRPFQGAGLGGGGGRPANMPPIMRPGEGAALRAGGVPLGGGGAGGGVGGGGGGGRGGQGGGSRQLGLIEVGVWLPQIIQAITSQMGALARRESTMTRVAMALPGPYRQGTGSFGLQGTSSQLQGMARREAYGYTSTGELWGGVAGLQEYGLLNGGRRQDSALLRQASLAGRVSGLGFGAGAQMMEQFRNPQFVNQMQYLGISSPFRGGQMQLFNNKQGQSGLLEQLYQRMGGQGADWNKVLMPGSQQRQMLESMGMAPEQMRLLQQYGAARQEGVSPNDEKEWNRRFKDTGESLKELQKAFSELMDTLATGLVPLIKGLNTVLSPAVDFFEKLNDQVPALGQAVGVATTALLIWAAAAKAQSKIGAISAAVAERQAAGQAGGIGLAGLGAKLGSGGVALSAGGTLLATGGMLLGGIGGSMLGRKVGGKGTKGKIGSVLGGAGGGALTGAALGAAATAWGGPLAGLGAGTGAVAGGIIGGVAGLFGDAWPEWMREDVGDSDATPKDPAGGPASGKDLRGAKASDSNMNPEFARRLKQMFADNPALSLTSGWRDSATQARLFKEKPGLAAPPGKSNHEKGTAADIGPSSEYGWIAANASKYGLFLPMPSSADRKASGKKIEPWHVEPVGLTGSVPVQAVSADAVTPAGQKAPAKGKPKMTASPEVAPGGGMNVAGGSPAYQSATAVLGKTGGTQIGDAWGDNEVDYYGTSGRSGGRGKASITIGRIEINVSIARATPEEADRFARSVGSMLGDRDRLLALARTGGRDN